jgi:hypothetical protein
MAGKKYTVEMTNNNGQKVPITQVPLEGGVARDLAEKMRKQLPAGSSAYFEVHDAKGGKR